MATNTPLEPILTIQMMCVDARQRLAVFVLMLHGEQTSRLHGTTNNAARTVWVRIGKQHARLFADISSTIDLTIRQHQQVGGRALLHYSLRKPETSPITFSSWQFSADDPVHVFTDTFGHKTIFVERTATTQLNYCLCGAELSSSVERIFNRPALLLHAAIISMTSFNTIYEVIKPGLYFEHKSMPYSQTILHTWGASSRPPMPIYAVGIAQVPSIHTPTIRRPGYVDAGLSLGNSPRPLRIRRLLRGIYNKSISLKWYANRCCVYVCVYAPISSLRMEYKRHYASRPLSA